MVRFIYWRAALLALAALSLLGLGAVWNSVAVANTQPAPTVEAPLAGDNLFPVTDSMTDTMQLVLDAYLAAHAAPGLAPAADPVEIELFRPVAMLPLVVRGAGAEAPETNPTVTPPPTVTPHPNQKGADIAITLWPDPAIRVARGGVVAYALRVTNYGEGAVERTALTLPFNRQHLTLLNAALDTNKGDWVRSASDTRVVVSFGPLEKNITRTGTVFFRINASLATDTVLDMRAQWSWDDARGGHDGAGSNWAPVLVGSGNDSAPYVWLKVDPASGTPAASRLVTSNRYAPGEGVVTWLNTPSGVKPFEVRGVADASGAIALRFSSAGLPSGTYQIVVYGTRSALTGVATFTVV